MQNRATRVMSEWHQMLREELDARRPILYTGSTKSGGGHMFVIDGYTQENYYHINWGWSGSSNGYYLLTVMNPSNPGSGSSSGGYTQEQAAFFDLIPDKNGTSAFTDNLVLVRKEVNGVYYEGLVIDANDIQTNQEFKISIGAVNNIGRSVFDGNLRIALADKDGTIKEYISEKIPVRFPADSHQNCITDCSCKITLPIKAGDRIRVYYKGKYSEDWDYLRGGSLLRSEIILKEEDIPLEKMTSFAYDKENKKNLTDEQVLEAASETQEKLHIAKSKSGIVVKGIHDVAVRFSKCCNPIPGDEIVGFVTRGRGITIHRTDCVNVLNMSETDRTRLIEAEWQQPDTKEKEKYTAEIQVYANNRTGLLVDLSKIFTERKIDLRSINSRTSKQEKATISMSFEIGSKEELRSLIEKIRQVESVIDVERTTG